MRIGRPGCEAGGAAVVELWLRVAVWRSRVASHGGEPRMAAESRWQAAFDLAEAGARRVESGRGVAEVERCLVSRRVL